MTFLLGSTLIAFVASMYALAFWSQQRIHDEADFLVAGRRLPLFLSTATLLATWFGAGTMLTATDEVRRVGLKAIALEPLGSGVCLLIAGFFFARPLWRMKLLTLADFFRVRFGPKAELVASLIIAPSYFGWIAVQFTALAAMLELLFGIPEAEGILLVAVIGTGYTLLGGMWSVTLTDAVQIVVVVVGLLILGGTTLLQLGNGSAAEGWTRLTTALPTDFLQPIPLESATALLGWVGVFSIAALGNIPAQDLMQRVFSARNEQVAQRACWISGVSYVALGMIPVSLGLASIILFPEARDQAILPLLARSYLSPALMVVFTLALSSAVLSTIDSAILSPAAIIGHNILPRMGGFAARIPPLLRTRLAIVFVSAGSVITAFMGDSAYSLLEEAYALTLVGLLVPLTLGIYGTRRNEGAALISMVTGCGCWLVHLVADWDQFLEPFLVPMGIELPTALTAAFLGLLAYVGASVTLRPGTGLSAAESYED